MSRSVFRINRLRIGVFLALLLALGSCRSTKVIQESPLPPLSESEIMDRMNQTTFSFGEMSARVAVDIDSERRKGQFRVNLRMAQDSLIWMSIVPALGIEAARVLFTTDSIKFIDKLKNRYFLADIASLDSMIGHGAEFTYLQNLLTGNPIEILEKEKYTAFIDGPHYVLQTKSPRKLRKALDMDFRSPEGDTLQTEVVNERLYVRALDKLEDEDLIIKRYYIRGDDFRVARTVVEYFAPRRTVVVQHEVFENFEGYSFPVESTVRIQTPTEEAEFDLRFSRLRMEENQGYPFKIPDSYAPLR